MAALATFHSSLAPLFLGPVLLGLGVYGFLSAFPPARPHPDLAERLARLDVAARLAARARPPQRPLFASRLAEALLRPLLEDLGHALAVLLARLGLVSAERLARQLDLARPGVTPAQFYGEKLLSALVGGGLFPLMTALGVTPFGAWPLTFWAGGAALGWLAPDGQLAARLSSQRAAVLEEVPALLDLLSIAASAGFALEQALSVTAQQGQGRAAEALRQALGQVALGRRALPEAIEEAAERLDAPELRVLAGTLRAVHDQGLPLVQALMAQAEALREQQRLHVLEEGGKTGIRMLLPVAVFILPVVFVILLYPAVVQIAHL